MTNNNLNIKSEHTQIKPLIKAIREFFNKRSFQNIAWSTLMVSSMAMMTNVSAEEIKNLLWLVMKTPLKV